MKSLLKKEIFIFLTLISLSILEIRAQTARPISQSVDAAVSRSLETKARSNELERVKNEADREILSKRESAKRFPEIKEDFERIQTINFHSLQNNVLKENLDYKEIGKAAAEIKKLAKRLNKNLFPEDLTQSVKPADDKTEKSARLDLSKAALKTLFVALDNEIYRFVSNNLFQNINVVNLDDSVKAQIALNKIIEICGFIENKSK